MITIIEFYDYGEHLIKCFEDIDAERIFAIDYDESTCESFGNLADFTMFLSDTIHEIRYINEDYNLLFEEEDE